MHSSKEEIKVSINTSLAGTDIKLSLDDGAAQYGGFISRSAPDRISAYALTVEPEYRGKGLGEKLVRRLVDEATHLGANKLTGHIESQYALDIRARIFGKNALRFYDDEAADFNPEEFPEKYDELSITFDQARQSLVRAEEYEEDTELRQIGFSVEVDLPKDSDEGTIE